MNFAFGMGVRSASWTITGHWEHVTTGLPVVGFLTASTPCFTFDT